MLKYSFNLGALIGGSLFIVRLIAYLTGQYDSTLFEVVSYVILAGGLAYGIRNYRDGIQGGYIAYERSLGLGTLLSVASAIVFSILLYIYLKFVDGTALEMAMESAKQGIYDSGDLSDEEIDTAIEALPALITPGFTAVISVLIYTFVGFIFSLIVSIFMKKNEPFTDIAQ